MHALVLVPLALGALNAPPQECATPGAALAPSDSPGARGVADGYVELAGQRYSDALERAKDLLKASLHLIDAPSEESLKGAREAWIRAHATYSHCEVFRFGNPNVDAWEGSVNAWPMDEGLIDYVADGYVHHEGNPFARANVIGRGHMPITDELIAEMKEGADPKAAPISDVSDIESNVTTGYHAVEFLLWGQDLDPAGPGQRPYTDFERSENCTGGACPRRCDYLAAATRLLIADLRVMVVDWNPESGLYGARFAELPITERLDRMIVGLGSLGFAEVASERIQVALLTGDQEEEQSCFSDTSLVAIEHNLRGIEDTYLGRHTMADGSKKQGPALADLVAQVEPELDTALRMQLAKVVESAAALAAGEATLDVLVRPENAEGHAALEALIAELRAQTELFERVRALIPRLAAVGN